MRSINKTCYNFNSQKGVNTYRPIFWYSNQDKTAYEDYFNIKHSKCYTEYGMKRTGCAGCPYALDFENNLKIIEKYEPKLYKAVNYIFGNSYEYTRKYKQFVKENS